jgi:DNA-binding MarR family transcriptional regulator
MDKRVVELLEDLKKLLILELISKDIPGKDIAAVLGVDPAVVSRIVARRSKSKKKN